MVITTIDTFFPKISKDELYIFMKLIQLISSIIAEPLAYIFNLCILSGTGKLQKNQSYVHL